MKAIIKILDEVNAVLIGLHAKDIAFLYDKFGIYAKGYFFSPKFKLGRWDGKIHFFTKTGKTYVHLLPEIIDILKNFGYKFDLIDNRKYFEINIPVIDNTYLSAYPNKSGSPTILGDHQVDAINAATRAHSGIVLAGTGSGKTLMAAALLKLYEEHAQLKGIVIVPTGDLVRQTRKGIYAYGADVGIYSGDEKDIDHVHVVSTWQALQNNKEIVGMFNVIIVDECHGIKGPVLREIINDYGGNAPVKLGLTGTLPKEPSDLLNVRISLGNVLCEIPAYELMESGWLAQLRLLILILEEDLRKEWQIFQIQHPDKAKDLTYAKFKNQLFPDWDSEVKYLKNNMQRNEVIASLVQEAVEKRGNTLVLVNGVAYGKKLSSLIPNSYFIYGEDDGEVREEIYKLFETNDDIVVVTSFQLASTGLDIPRIMNMFMIDAGKSFERVIQSIGRGLRKASDKNEVYIYDIASDLKAGKKHLAARKKYYEEQLYKYKVEKLNYIGLVGDGIEY